VGSAAAVHLFKSTILPFLRALSFSQLKITIFLF